MKKFLLTAVFMVFVLAGTAAAGDTHMSIMYGDQDALIIGKVVAKEGGRYIVNVEKLLMGNIDGGVIEVDDFKLYGFTGEPGIGDYGVFSLDKKRSIYQVKYGAYKADKADYKTLKLSNSHYGIIAEIQKFINSGKFYEADKKAKEREQKELEAAQERLKETEQNAVQSADSKRGESLQKFLMIVTGSMLLTGIVFAINRKI